MKCAFPGPRRLRTLLLYLSSLSTPWPWGATVPGLPPPHPPKLGWQELSAYEPGELSQWFCHDDSTINIVIISSSIILLRPSVGVPDGMKNLIINERCLRSNQWRNYVCGARRQEIERSPCPFPPFLSFPALPSVPFSPFPLPPFLLEVDTLNCI